jgi:hypothetical protein
MHTYLIAAQHIWHPSAFANFNAAKTNTPQRRSGLSGIDSNSEESINVTLATRIQQAVLQPSEAMSTAQIPPAIPAMESRDPLFDFGSVMGHFGSMHGANRRDARPRDYSYGKIRKLEMELEYIDERFRSHQVASKKRISTELRRDQLQRELIELQNGHRNLAKTMQTQASRIQQLPREMRLAVFEKLYVQESCIEIKSERIGENIVFQMPNDLSMYLSKAHVGETVASDAGEIFYKHNTFLLQPWHIFGRKGAQWIDKFFDTDHYGSGAGTVPRNLVRTMEVLIWDREYWLGPPEMDTWLCEDGLMPRHDRFETEYDRIFAIKSFPWSHMVCRRKVLEHIVTALHNLRELRIDLGWANVTQPGLLRLINPVVRQALTHGVKVKILKYVNTKVVDADGNETYEAGQEDLISLFEQPSDLDYDTFRKVADRYAFQISETADPLDVWWKMQEMPMGLFRHDGSQVHEVGYAKRVRDPVYRVWLQEHFDIWRWRQANRRLIESFEAMQKEIQLASKESLPDRKRYYLKLLALMNPGPIHS